MGGALLLLLMRASVVVMSRTPVTYNVSPIAINTATNIVAASGSTVVYVWGYQFTGGTSVKFTDTGSAGDLTGAMATPVSQPVVQPYVSGGNAMPYFQSSPGYTLTITPGASGLAGVVYWSQM